MYENSGYDGGLFALGAIFWLVILAAWLFLGWTQFKIAKKCGQHDCAWWGFIPILNLFLTVKTAGKEWWWFLLCLVPFVNLIALAALWIWTAKRAGFSGIWGFLVLVPFLNIVALSVMAFSGGQTGPTPPSTQRRTRQPEHVA